MSGCNKKHLIFLSIVFLCIMGCELPETETLKPTPNCEETNTCEIETPFCGDGHIDAEESCDDGNTNTEICVYGETYCTICDANCQEVVGQTSFCGDEVVDRDNGEECDDGNTVETDDCTTLCKEPLCGNGVIDDNEECDDGNDINIDDCTNVCTLPTCGDGIISTNEECDDNNQITETCDYGETSCEVCSGTCVLASGITSFCGDGITDSENGEGCDEGSANGLPTSTCRTNCIAASCGDNSVDIGEECDNGAENGLNNECDNACQYQPFLLKDLNTETTADSDGYVLGRLNDTLFIIGVTSTFQVLLYGYDTVTQGYEILTQFEITDYFSVESFKIGVALVTSSHFYMFTELEETSYLWRSDGTAVGTTLVKTIEANCGRSYTSCNGHTGIVLPLQAPEAEERILFDGYDDIFGHGLWSSDGTTEGTHPLYASDSLNIRPTEPERLMMFNNEIYFTATTDETGEELWRTDGSAQGTNIVSQIIEGAGGTIFTVQVLPAGIALSARHQEYYYEPHLYDGTTMRLLADIHSNGSSYPDYFVQLNNKVCYAAEHDDFGEEVFCTHLDTQEPNYYLLKDIAPAEEDSKPNTLVSTGTQIFFFARDRTNGRYKLWVSDGSESNTQALFSATDNHLEEDNYQHTMVALGDKVYFHAKATDTAKYSIFSSQGALSNTVRLAEVETPSASHTQRWLVDNDTLYFQGKDSIHGFEPWYSDGTSDGTAMILDFNPASNSAIPPAKATLLGEKIFFTAKANGLGEEPYISDGTPEGTFLLNDINPNEESSYPSVMGVLNDVLIFSAYEPIGGRELWRTDGTVEGTEQIAELVPGNSNTWASYASPIGDVIYFAGEDEEGVHPWKTDGTLAGTKKIKTIYPDGNSYPKYFTSFNNKIFFQASSPDEGRELWASDGTESGTSLFADIRTGPSGSYPKELMATQSNLFFIAEGENNNREVWTTDGENGVTKLTDTLDGNSSDGVYLYSIATFGDTYYFGATTESEGVELWSSDGTVGGTTLLIDFELGSGSSSPYQLFQDEEILFLSVGTSNQGRELWSLNMSDNSFLLLKDIATGPRNGIPLLNYKTYDAFTKGADGLYYFTASNENNGTELWRTDGTAAGTRLFKDLAPGMISSMPGSLKSTEGFLFFRALHTEFGYETWRYTFSETP